MPVDPSGEGRAPETPEFTDLHSRDFPSLGHALERSRMNSENRRSLLTVQENFDLFPCELDGGDGSRDWLLVCHLARSCLLEQDRWAGKLLSNQNPYVHYSVTEYSFVAIAGAKQCPIDNVYLGRLQCPIG